jgi:GntP family gluconate:H+ symporter
MSYHYIFFLLFILCFSVFLMSPLLILLIGVAVVLTMILALRTNAFLALIAAALVVSFLNKSIPYAEKGKQVAVAFGATVGDVGIVIAMATIIGVCMMKSGAAEKIVLVLCRVLGEKRFPAALCGSGFVLSIPVFYDTVFYLLVPLVRSFYLRVRKNYILCLMAICAGAMITHALVPPTPGPLLVASSLNANLGHIMIVSLLVGGLLFPVGIAAAYFIDWYMPSPEIHFPQEELSRQNADNANPVKREKATPPFGFAILPVLTPVVLIAFHSFVTLTLENAESANTSDAFRWFVNILHVVGSKEIAMILAAILAIFMYYRQKIATLHEIRKDVDAALLDGGLIILITAAGGTFGKMLQAAGIGKVIENFFQHEAGVSGVGILAAAFCIASILKLSLGSSTTAMMVAAAIVGSMNLTTETLGFNLAYLCLSICCGSLVTSWMNDSGFWIASRMAGISETDTLKSVSVLHIIVGCSGFVIILILSRILPLAI